MLPMAMMGIAFSLVPAVMWPSVALIVDSSKLGTAYGLMTMIQNIGFSVLICLLVLQMIFLVPVLQILVVILLECGFFLHLDF